MAKQKKQKIDKAKLIKSQKTKRCWSCNTHMQLHLPKCPSCNRKVGDVNEHGIAVRPVQWVNYGLSILTAAVLAYFIYWGFLKNG